VVLDALLLGGGLYFGGLSLGPFLFVAAVAALVQTPIWQAKEVLAEDSGLRVRGLRTEAVIPYDQIAEVRKPWLRSAVVHVHLRSDSPFGNRVVFLPPWGIAQPAVELLRRRVAGG
jgi:hypothetical protein